MPKAAHAPPLALVVDEDDLTRNGAEMLLGETELPARSTQVN